MSQSPIFFPGIHALRFLAATLVVFDHAAFVSTDYFLFGFTIINPYFSYGRSSRCSGLSRLICFRVMRDTMRFLG
jgi:peptidoglycan/LPS O-acetylase OafA/YrhL